MKCSHCYAENQAWATVCSSCGQSVLRLEVCSLGHLLPPGVQECPVCPSLWPEVEAFAGPPLLRGLLWVVNGRLASAAEPARPISYVEVRDQESPLALTPQPSGAVHIVAAEDQDTACRILMRPEGVQVCDRSRAGRRTGPPTYAPLAVGQSLDLGATTLRLLEVRPPLWVQNLAGSLQKQKGPS